jgi:hypothetical protein
MVVENQPRGGEYHATAVPFGERLFALPVKALWGGSEDLTGP